MVFDESGDHVEDTTGEFTGVKKKGNANQTLGRILRTYNPARLLQLIKFAITFTLANL